jgi:hypothetical protein
MTPKTPYNQPYNREPRNQKSPNLYKYTYKTTSIYEYISSSIRNPFYRLTTQGD